MTVIDTFLQKISDPQKNELERIRAIARGVVPDAEETIAYGMPTLKYKGKSFLGFNALKNHIGIYPYGGEEINVFKDILTKNNYEFSLGAIRVPFDKPITEALLTQIIQHRIKRIDLLSS
jgi:uncharacterized protein YdhG (YjbR/CyaY superfamily)